MTTASRAGGLLARVFRPFARVEPGEAVGAAGMMLAAFLLMCAYYQLKTVREPLVLLEGGAEVKLYARAAQAVLMVGVVQLYGELAKRVGRLKLLGAVFLFFVSNLVVFAVLSRTSVPIGLAFFLWVGLFSYTSVAQFWALAADMYTEDQGKRLFPVIGIGSSTGAVAGARLARSLVPTGPHALMIAAIALLLACMGLLAWLEWRSRAAGSRRAGAATGSAQAAKDPHEVPVSTEGALHLLLRDRYLLLIAALNVLLNWVNSAGEYVFDRTILVAVADAGLTNSAAHSFVGGIKADYFAWYNGIGMLLQLFAVSRVLAKVGVRGALLVLPVFACAGYGAATLAPTLAVIRLVKVGENALEYSLAETSRHALYLMTSRVEKYVGKTSVDTIAVRVGAVLSGLFVWIGGRAHWPIATFVAINAALTLAWIAVVLAIGREHARRSAENETSLAAEPAAA